MTNFSNKVSILRDLWIQYRDDEYFSDLFEINDLGFPLAFAIFHDQAIPSNEGMETINQTWNNFLEYINVDDTGFEDLTEIYFVE